MSLGKKSTKSAAWSLIGLVANQGLNIVRLAVFARLLSPGDFGLYAMCMIFYTFFARLGDVGTSAAIIQRQSVAPTLPHTIFYLNLIIATIFFSILYGSAPLIASVYNNDNVQDITRWLALVLIVISFGFVHSALLKKQLKFKEIALANTLANAVSSVLSIWMALAGFGVSSLIAHLFLQAFITNVYFWFVSGWRPKLLFKLSDLKSILGFTSNLTGYNVVSYLSGNIDKFAVGKVLGAIALGNYYVAYRIVVVPTTQLNASIRTVLFSSLATVKDDSERYREIFLRIVAMLSAMTAPAMALVCALAVPITQILFGEKWDSASTLMSILAPATYLQSVAGIATVICLTNKRADILLKYSVVQLFAILVSVLVFMHLGVVWVAVAYSLGILIYIYPFLKECFALIGLTVNSVLLKLLRSVACSVVVGICVYLGHLYSQQLSNVPIIASTVALFAAGSVLYIALMGRGLISELKYLQAQRK